MGGSKGVKFLLAFFLIVTAGAGLWYYRSKTLSESAAEPAYILPEKVQLMNTPAAVRVRVAEAKRGDRVMVLERQWNWAQVRLADGRRGWLDQGALLDAETYEQGRRLFIELQRELPQASGRTITTINVRFEPSRDAPVLTQLAPYTPVEVFDRQVVERTAEQAEPGEARTPAPEVWYLVRTETDAGWLLGRAVRLEIPEEISMYAVGTNIVAWLVVSRVEDEGNQVPQYLVAERVGAQEIDFNRIRVFTWWKQRKRYATAYVESNLHGYFPLRIRERDGRPHFRLRLTDAGGRKYQKVYAMFDTIVRPLGTVEGWESEELPERPPARRGAGR
jgi:hypothetical protein